MSPSRTIRIGLLICGSLTGPVEAGHGDYSKVYNRYLKSTIPHNSRVNIIVEDYNIKLKEEFPNEDQILATDIFVVTGSAASAYDDSIAWIPKLNSFLQHVINDHPKVKIAGICFGHQIVARALGGKCVPNSRWEIGPTSIDLTDLGKSLFGAAKLCLQQMHRDHVPVDSLSEQFSSGELGLIGYTGVSGNQGFIRFYPQRGGSSAQDIHILCVQGHPEFSESLVTAIVRQRSADGVMDSTTVMDYWGKKGGDYDDEPEDKSETGRRWNKTDGLDVFANVLWKMAGVSS